MLMKKIHQLGFAFCFLFSTVFSATFNYSGTIASLTSTGGDTFNLTGVTITGPVNITGTNVVINIIGAGALTLQGNVVMDGDSTDTIQVNSTSGYINLNSPSLFMRNVKLTNTAGQIIRSYAVAVGNTITLEKVNMTASTFVLDVRNVILKARFSKFANTGAGTVANVNFNASGAALPAPVFEFCSFSPSKTGANYHLTLSAAAGYAGGVADLEGSYFVGGPNIFSSVITYDNSPASSSGDPFGTTGTTALQCAGGTFTWDKIIPNGSAVAFTSSVTIPSGQTWRIGYDERNVVYSGNSGMYFANATGITVQNGGTLTTQGTASLYNTFSRISAGAWTGITLQNGSLGTITRTNFMFGSPEITDQRGSTLTNNNFGTYSGAANVALLVQAAGGSYTNNLFDTIGYGIQTNSTCTIQSNTFSVMGTTGIQVSGGTPIIQSNVFSNASNVKALNITAGSFPAGNIAGNNFGARANNITATGATGVVYVENNYFGAATPALSNFGGTDAIDYEPWYNASAAGASTQVAPTTVDRLTILPADTANLPAAPNTVTFNITDVGYYNGTPLRYSVQFYDSAFTPIGVPSGFIGAYPGQGGQVVYAVPAGTTALMTVGNTYYWSALAENTASLAPYRDSAAPAPLFSFSIAKPDLTLTLTSDQLDGAASAGDAVVYTVTFTNAPTNFVVMNTATITSILPDEVYFNGTLVIRNTNIAAGLVGATATAYSDIAGTTPLGTAPVAVGAGGSITAVWAPAINNSLVKRIDLSIPGNIAVGESGQMVYTTIVK